MRECSRSTCFVPETVCDLGFLDRSKCPAWQGQIAPTSDNTGGADEVLLPWSGSALGLVDLGFVAGRAKPIVVGIAGAQSAGKTTLLAAWYLLLGRGLVNDGVRRFAGSYSLAGWEAVASALRWGPGQPPRFPPHTTSRGGRAPGANPIVSNHWAISCRRKGGGRANDANTLRPRAMGLRVFVTVGRSHTASTQPHRCAFPAAMAEKGQHSPLSDAWSTGSSAPRAVV
jgi:hypothetical protein